MELKVHVEQTIRIVCGLTDETSVHDVILALAQALKQTGRFYLVECWSGRKMIRRSSRARVMSPSERPLQTLKSYASLLDSPDDVEFHLVRTSAVVSSTSTSTNPSSSSPLFLLTNSQFNQSDRFATATTTGNFSSLLANINRQQYLLNEQAARY